MSVQLYVPVQSCALISALLGRISRAVLVAIADTLLFRRDVIGAPAVLPLHYREGVVVFALIVTCAVGLIDVVHCAESAPVSCEDTDTDLSSPAW